MIVKSSELINEHEQIERELIELDTIINFPIINYPNLYHVMKKIRLIWDSHEEKEELFFNALYKKGFTIPVKKITFEHGKLKKDMSLIMNAINSGSEFKTKEALKKDGINLINQIRKHIDDENWIFYALPKNI